ncbi:flagellin hook IN motif-containing protein [Psychromonas sp. KJ10-10]|uniref:flagellin N-terminal helical domain-containing protein n=1 Tax=Psychromonas sp. KJ10-10 TaxID=3391823 RepID=UPI0039B40AA7
MSAGLAISTGMQSQISGINQAVRNANDGISMTQTAEGSMDEMTNILQRMRELSVQSANDTNSAENRASIQKEVDQLSSELDRIAETTEFNGTKLLDGSAGSTTLQIGANSGQTLSFSIDSVTTNDLGLNGNLNKEDVNGGRVTSGDVAASSIEINGVSIGAVETSKDYGNALANMASVINEKSAETGVTASAYNVVQGDAIDSAGAVPSGITSGMTIKVGDGATTTLGATSSMDNLVDTINRDITGVTASLGDQGELLLTNDTGAEITVAGTTAGSGMTSITGAQEGYIALKSDDGSAISVNDFEDTTSASNASDFGFTVVNGADSILATVASYDATDGITAADGLQINGVDLIASSAVDIDTTVSAVNALTEETGVTATAVGTSIQFSTSDGSAVEITSNATTQVARDTALALVGLDNEMGGKSIDSLGTDVSTMSGAMSSIDKIDACIGENQ